MRDFHNKIENILMKKGFEVTYQNIFFFFSVSVFTTMEIQDFKFLGVDFFSMHIVKSEKVRFSKFYK